MGALGLDSALALIDSVRESRVLFVGDTIIDEYHYVTALGKSPKEHLIPVQYKSREVFSGGVRAAAKHARSFCARVDITSAGPITRKVRIVDSTYLRKLFEIHYTDGHSSDYTLASDHDVTVVTDFGHGAIKDTSFEGHKFLAVNAQTNSANIGFNLITKYPRADYIVIDEPEARLAAADRDSPIEDVIRRLAEGRCPKMVVTLGTGGAVGYDGTFHRMPALTNRVLDTLGAGDAFFAVTAPMARTGDMADLLLIGNAAGAMKCEIVGHRESVTKEALISYLRTNG